MNAEIGQTAFKDVIHELVVLNKQPKIQWWPPIELCIYELLHDWGIDFGQ